MADALVVTVAQPGLVDHDVAVNAERHAALVRRAGGRVVVFPELSLTGYRLDADPVDTDDRRLRTLVAACAEVRSVALVGAPTTGPAGDRLSILAVDGDGVRIAYDKLYLGADESARFRPGRQPSVIDVDGWRLGLAICRDAGVPEHAARTTELGIDAYLAGVCEHAADGGVVEERARRIAGDHGVWVGVASFAGSTGHGYEPAAGGSGLWGPDGRPRAVAGPAPDRLATASFDR